MLTFRPTFLIMLCLATLVAASCLANEKVLLDMATTNFVPQTIAFEKGRPVAGSPKCPQHWQARCWNMKSSARLVVGPDPVTHTNAMGFINVSGVPSLALTRRTPITLEPNSRYALTIDYLTTGTGAGRAHFVIPQIPAEPLPPTANTWQLRTVEFDSGDVTVLILELRSTRLGDANALYVRRISLSTVKEEEVGDEAR